MKVYNSIGHPLISLDIGEAKMTLEFTEEMMAALMPIFAQRLFHSRNQEYRDVFLDIVENNYDLAIERNK